uniref:Uncharacterized protein n=1 Tax=Panagrolaimus sp. JU765 TaxID=591449 RepID=A0AC34R7W9_9BILA
MNSNENMILVPSDSESDPEFDEQCKRLYLEAQANGEEVSSDDEVEFVAKSCQKVRQKVNELTETLLQLSQESSVAPTTTRSISPVHVYSIDLPTEDEQKPVVVSRSVTEVYNDEDVGASTFTQAFEDGLDQMDVRLNSELPNEFDYQEEEEVQPSASSTSHQKERKKTAKLATIKKPEKPATLKELPILIPGLFDRMMESEKNVITANDRRCFKKKDAHGNVIRDGVLIRSKEHPSKGHFYVDYHIGLIKSFVCEYCFENKSNCQDAPRIHHDNIQSFVKDRKKHLKTCPLYEFEQKKLV